MTLTARIAGFLLIAAGSTTPVFAADIVEAPVPVLEFEVPLETTGFLMSYNPNGIMLPQLQVYSAGKLRLANITQVPLEKFIPLVEEALGKEQGDMQMELAAGGWTDKDGGRMDPASLPDAEFYFVEYWAEWCKPCHQLQAELFEYLAEREINAVVIKVELDPMKLYDK